MVYLFPLVWVVSAAKLQPPFSSPALRSLHGRPGRSGSLRSTDLQSLSLSLSCPHLANDEAHALHHRYACSESTSASLRPKLLFQSYVFSSIENRRAKPVVVCIEKHNFIDRPICKSQESPGVLETYRPGTFGGIDDRYYHSCDIVLFAQSS